VTERLLAKRCSLNRRLFVSPSYVPSLGRAVGDPNPFEHGLVINHESTWGRIPLARSPSASVGVIGASGIGGCAFGASAKAFASTTAGAKTRIRVSSGPCADVLTVRFSSNVVLAERAVVVERASSIQHPAAGQTAHANWVRASGGGEPYGFVRSLTTNRISPGLMRPRSLRVSASIVPCSARHSRMC
jgi:hypothetical protein